MAITDWPHQDRPREKLLSRGAEALSDAELLAIFLRTGIQGCSAVDLARQLLDGFGSLRALLTEQLSDLELRDPSAPRVTNANSKYHPSVLRVLRRGKRQVGPRMKT